jgi:hypothetical protein
VQPLRLVITSATLDGEKFSAYFGDCPVFDVPGRQFPVQVVHSLDEHRSDYLQAAVDTALTLHESEPPGERDAAQPIHVGPHAPGIKNQNVSNLKQSRTGPQPTKYGKQKLALF